MTRAPMEAELPLAVALVGTVVLGGTMFDGYAQIARAAGAGGGGDGGGGCSS